MSTITDGCRRSGRFLCAATAVAIGWFLLVAVATLALEPVRTVVVIAPLSSSLAALTHADARLIDVRAGLILVRGEHEGFVRQLYAGGGWLVLPALTGGCRGDRTLRVPGPQP